jgi:hypothetical protein
VLRLNKSTGKIYDGNIPNCIILNFGSLNGKRIYVHTGEAELQQFIYDRLLIGTQLEIFQS